MKSDFIAERMTLNTCVRGQSYYIIIYNRARDTVVWLRPVKYHHGYCPILCQLSKWSLCLRGMGQMPEINVNDKGICNPPDSEILGIKGSSSTRRWRRDDSLSGTRTAIGCLRLLPVKKVRKSRKKKPNPSQRGPKLDGKRQLSTRTRGPCRRIDVLQGAKKCHRKCTNRCYGIRNTCEYACTEKHSKRERLGKEVAD